MEQMDKNKDFYFGNTAGVFFGKYWLFLFSIIMLCISINLNISSIIITNESIVLTFIGILATFIVVGNYAQVIQIKNETESKIIKLEQSQNKLNELNDSRNVQLERLDILITKMTDIENNLLLTTSKSYYSLAIIAHDQKHYKHSIRQSVIALEYLNKSGKATYSDEAAIFVNMELCLQKDDWNIGTNKFDYHDAYKRISQVTVLEQIEKSKLHVLSLLNKKSIEFEKEPLF